MSTTNRPKTLDEVIEGATSDEAEVDFSGAVDFEPLADGDYLFEIETIENGTSKPKPPAKFGNPKIVWKFVCLEDGAVGRVIFAHTPTTGKGAGLTKNILKALDIDVSEDKIKVKFSQLVGRQVILNLRRQRDKVTKELTDFNEIAKVKQAPTESQLD